MTAKQGTVEAYQEHARCLQRIAQLTALLEEIVDECEDREDADMQGDPPAYVPNIWMQLHLRIREVLPR